MTSSYGVEDLKRILAAEDDDFRLIPSKNPRNTYKIVWCNVPGSWAKKCKVDILVPGIMNIPAIPDRDIIWFDNRAFPSIPLLPLLLLKLQGWDDHRNASFRRPDLIIKQYVDVGDINALLLIAQVKGVHRTDGVPTLPSSFLHAADLRVRQYVQYFPSSANHWRAIGFA
jgi:hypothetical protein